MSKWLKIIFVISALCGANAAHAAQYCGNAVGFDMIYFEGEVAGQNSFSKTFSDKKFSLTPNQYGWQIAVKNAEGIDLAGITPPLQNAEVNPRLISGWHFRNANNTDKNNGDVNAPQTTREFSFGTMAAPDEIGHGDLVIIDMGLADLGKGQKARMNYLKFSTCIYWPESIGIPATLTQTAEAGVPTHATTFMQQCGLNPKIYRLANRMIKGTEGERQAVLRPDFNGDGQTDFAVAISRLEDNLPGLAICLAGQDRPLIIGYNGQIGESFDPLYFYSADFWQVETTRQFSQGVGEVAPPTSLGDAILLAKTGSSSVLLYMDKNMQLNSYWQGD